MYKALGEFREGSEHGETKLAPNRNNLKYGPLSRNEAKYAAAD